MKIFVASTGRCGTKYLAEIFNRFTDFPSYHEPIPFIINKALAEINNGNTSNLTRAVLEKKIEQIERDSNNGLYMESNQQFIKGYVNTVLDTWDDVYCIYLYRNPMDVLISYSQKCKQFEVDWFLQPFWKNNILPSYANMRSFYTTVLWQWYEVRERYYKYQPLFKETYELDFEKLNDVDELKMMFEQLGIKHRLPDTFPPIDKNPVVAISRKSKEEILDHIRKNWETPGIYRFKTDAQYLGIAQ